MRIKVICQYCNRPAKLVTGQKIYPHRSDLWGLKFWECQECDARVGCHKQGNNYGDGTVPFGTLANAELRALRHKAHQEFDRLWRQGPYSRKEAYAWLATVLNLKVEQCHIGQMDEEDCNRVLKAVQYA